MSYGDRIRETTTSTGAGNVTLAGAAANKRALSAAFAVGTSGIRLLIDGGAEWELCSCTLIDAVTIRRDYTIVSSNSDAPVSFSAGVKQVVHGPTAFDLTRGLIDPDEPGFDIVGLFGQSNAVGQGTFDASVDLADNRVWQFGCKSGDARYQTIFSGVDPLHTTERVNTGYVSAGTWAARALASVTPSHRRILLVPVCYGGTGLINGAPNNWAYGSPSGGTYYEAAISQTNLAIAAAQLWYPSSRFAGFFWMQGEADSVYTQAAYSAALSAMIAGMRARIANASASWVVISEMVPTIMSTLGGYANIALAHRQVALEVAKVGWVPGPTGRTPDNVHYDAAGLRIIGSRLGSAVPATKLQLAGSTTAPGQPTGLTNGTMTGSTAPLSWMAPATGGTPLHVFVEYKASASGTWLTKLTTFGVMTSATVTGLAGGTSYDFRIVYANEAGRGTASSTLTVSTAAGVTVPDAPAIGTATAGNASASVTFTPPASDGGSAITGYTVTSTPGGLTGTGASSPITVAGLTNGTAYTFTVHATNAIGNSAESAASNSATPSAPAFATWNPADKATGLSLAAANLQVTNGGGAWRTVRSTVGKSAGKWYWEVHIDSGSNIMIGVGDAVMALTSFAGQDSHGVGYYSVGGEKFVGGSFSAYLSAYATGDVIQVALDMDAATVKFGKNNTYGAEISISAITGPIYAMWCSQNAAVNTADFGASAFAYTPPAGFVGLG